MAQLQGEPVQASKPPVIFARAGQNKKNLIVGLLQSLADDDLVRFGAELPVDGVHRVAGAVFPQFVLLGVAAAVFGLELYRRIQAGVDIRAFIRRSGIGQHGTHRFCRASAADDEEPQQIAALQPCDRNADHPAERGGQGDPACAGQDAGVAVFRFVHFAVIAVFQLQADVHPAEGQKGAGFEQYAKLRVAALAHPVRRGDLRPEAEHGGQGEEQQQGRQQTQRPHQIGPEPADIGQLEHIGPCQQSKIQEEMKGRHIILSQGPGQSPVFPREPGRGRRCRRSPETRSAGARCSPGR